MKYTEIIMQDRTTELPNPMKTAKTQMNSKLMTIAYFLRLTDENLIIRK